MTFLIATNNPHKVTEMSRILGPLGIECISAASVGIHVEPKETGKTFEENAHIKALAFAKASKMPVVADDSGLAVDALGGAPGIYSARYAGDNATDSDRINKLLHELSKVPPQKRAAKFICAVCCILSDGREIAVRGECPGHIAMSPQGENGFGYDPVFIEDSTGKSFACLGGPQKDKLSHRGRALIKLAEKLKETVKL